MFLTLGILASVLAVRAGDDPGPESQRPTGTTWGGLPDLASDLGPLLRGDPAGPLDEGYRSLDPGIRIGAEFLEPRPSDGQAPPPAPGAGSGISALDDLGWSLGASAALREVNGHLRVREHEVSGSTLNFRKDLGLDLAEGGDVTPEYRSPRWEGMVEVEYLTGSGQHTLNRDVFYNGTTYTADLPIRTLWEFLTVRALVALREVAWRPPFGEVAPVVGMEYPYYLTNVTSTAVPHNSEDWTHNYPYPVVGAWGRFPLSEDLSVGGRLTVAYVPNVPSLYTEGGRLYVSTRPSLAVDIPLEWHCTPHVLVSLDFQYRYWNGRDHSVEDGNVLRFSTPGVSLGVGYRW